MNGRHATTPRSTSHVHEAEHSHHTPTPFINNISANAALTARLTPLLPSGKSKRLTKATPSSAANLGCMPPPKGEARICRDQTHYLGRVIVDAH